MNIIINEYSRLIINQAIEQTRCIELLVTTKVVKQTKSINTDKFNSLDKKLTKQSSNQIETELEIWQ